MEANGLEEIEKEREAVAELAQSIAELDKEAKEREADIKELQAQNERQSGREVKDLAETADNLSKKCVCSLCASLPVHEMAKCIEIKRHGRVCNQQPVQEVCVLPLYPIWPCMR